MVSRQNLLIRFRVDKMGVAVKVGRVLASLSVEEDARQTIVVE